MLIRQEACESVQRSDRQRIRRQHAVHLSIAAHFNQLPTHAAREALPEDQADEERVHAMKFVKYPARHEGRSPDPGRHRAESRHLPPPPTPCRSRARLGEEVTRQITSADGRRRQGGSDYLAQSFLQWFIDEQLEEVVKMESRLVSVIKQSGEKNLLMVEAYLVHIEKAH